MAVVDALRSILKICAAAITFVATGYAAYAAIVWLSYGRVDAADDDRNAWLDRLMPSYDVVERHGIAIAAPAETTFAAADEIDPLRSPLIRAIFKTREKMMGARGN